MKGDVTRKGADFLSFQGVLFNSFKSGVAGFIVFITLSIATRFFDSIFFESGHHFVVMELWDFLLGVLCFALVFTFKFLERYKKIK